MWTEGVMVVLSYQLEVQPVILEAYILCRLMAWVKKKCLTFSAIYLISRISAIVCNAD